MARTLEMFEKPRKPRQWLMHVCDAGSAGPGEQLVLYRCNRCGHESEWTTATSVTAAKRGVPCPKCNKIANYGIEAIKALDGKSFAMLVPSEETTFNFYRDRGRKFGVLVCIVSNADPVTLAAARSIQEEDYILKKANGIISVTVVLSRE